MGSEPLLIARLAPGGPTYKERAMRNVIYCLRHPIKAWRHYTVQRAFARLFGDTGKAPF